MKTSELIKKLKNLPELDLAVRSIQSGTPVYDPVSVVEVVSICSDQKGKHKTSEKIVIR